MTEGRKVKEGEGRKDGKGGGKKVKEGKKEGRKGGEGRKEGEERKVIFHPRGGIERSSAEQEEDRGSSAVGKEGILVFVIPFSLLWIDQILPFQLHPSF